MQRAQIIQKHSGKLIAGLAAMLLALAPHPASAGKFKVLHSFCSENNCADGENPESGLVMDSSGNLYGVTTGGGAELSGAAFELKRGEAGHYKFKIISSFSSTPAGPLIIDTNGNLYGEYIHGGFFKLSPGFGRNGKKWKLLSLSNTCSQQDCGSNLNGGLAYLGSGAGTPYDGTSALYGVAAVGGANSAGTVFSLRPNGDQWDEVVLHNFCSTGGGDCTDGSHPVGRVTVDSSGALYGTVSEGGGNNVGKHTSGGGVAFKLTLNGNSWDYSVLYAFCSAHDCIDGAAPRGDLILDPTGDLFGTTAGGGRNCRQENGYGCGTLFKLNPNGGNGQLTVLYAFCSLRGCRDGADPEAALVRDGTGAMFGTTFQGGKDDQSGLGSGLVFKLAGSVYETLHKFCSASGCPDGENPEGSLILGPSGIRIGTTSVGGASDAGVVFELE